MDNKMTTQPVHVPYLGDRESSTRKAGCAVYQIPSVNPRAITSATKKPGYEESTDFGTDVSRMTSTSSSLFPDETSFPLLVPELCAHNTSHDSLEFKGLDDESSLQASMFDHTACLTTPTSCDPQVFAASSLESDCPYNSEIHDPAEMLEYLKSYNQLNQTVYNHPPRKPSTARWEMPSLPSDSQMKSREPAFEALFQSVGLSSQSKKLSRDPRDTANGDWDWSELDELQRRVDRYE